jgi:hypothetical protein
MSTFYVRAEQSNARAMFCLVGHVQGRGRSFGVLDFVVDGRAKFRVATADLAALERMTPVGFETMGDANDTARGGRQVVRVFDSMARALRLKVAPTDRPAIWRGDVLIQKGMMPLPRTHRNIPLEFYVIRLLLGKRREDVLEVELGYEGQAYKEGSTPHLRMGLDAGMRVAYGARLLARYRGLLCDPPSITQLSVCRAMDNGRDEGICLYTPGWTGQSALRLRDIPLVRDPRTRRDQSLGRWVISSRPRSPSFGTGRST